MKKGVIKMVRAKGIYRVKGGIKEVSEDLVKLYRLYIVDIDKEVKKLKEEGVYGKHYGITIYRQLYGIEDMYVRDIGYRYGFPGYLVLMGENIGIWINGKSIDGKKSSAVKEVEEALRGDTWDMIEDYWGITDKYGEWIEKGLIRCTDTEDGYVLEPGSGEWKYYIRPVLSEGMEGFIKGLEAFGEEGIKISKSLEEFIDSIDDYVIYNLQFDFLQITKEGDGYRIKFDYKKALKHPILSLFQGDGIYVKSNEEFRKGLQMDNKVEYDDEEEE